MDAAALAQRGKELAEEERKGLSESGGIGVRLDILDKMIDELNSDNELKAIYGEPVSAKLAVYSDGKDISIVDAGIVKLAPEQKLAFLMKLKGVYEKILKESIEKMKKVK